MNRMFEEGKRLITLGKKIWRKRGKDIGKQEQKKKSGHRRKV